ncbi:hypothetical protein TeGR_g8585 [Tetraparma gracilis]|uniref:Amino acid transporter transmembrane domain-containing protein n=1 Tax=Tetraparma gracilis TaxID=2962635 RepID=A0ABQ6MGU7_9STRA|nr:hypothetical protein TeGR_g8585 [Tetraparma gracilis]
MCPPPSPPRKLSSPRVSFVNFFKSLFGAGVLALPHAMSTVGLPLATSIYSLVLVCVVISCHLLLEAKRKASALSSLRGDGVPLRTYEDLSRYVLGPFWGSVSGGFVVVLNICFAAGFVICIRENMAAVYPSLSTPLLLSILSPLLLLLGQVRWLSDLVVFSFLSACIYFAGVIGASLSYSLSHWSPPDDLMEWRWGGIVAYTGTAVYALEGICLVLPCERAISDKTRTGGVVSSSLVIYGAVTMGYAAVALSSGIVTPECDIIVDCLDDGSGEGAAAAVANTVRLALSAALCLSHPIQLYPAVEILELAAERLLSPRSGRDGQLARADPREPGKLPPRTKGALGLVLLLGVFNMAVTGTSSFAKLVGITK